LVLVLLLHADEGHQDLIEPPLPLLVSYLLSDGGRFLHGELQVVRMDVKGLHQAAPNACRIYTVSQKNMSSPLTLWTAFIVHGASTR
jgi:hypothetical protein